jgi:hypothetical protein
MVMTIKLKGIKRMGNVTQMEEIHTKFWLENMKGKKITQVIYTRMGR